MTELYLSSGVNDTVLGNGISNKSFLVPPFLQSYKGKKFTFMFLNTGAQAIVLLTIGSDGQVRSLVIAPNSPGRARENQPWDLVSGGIAAYGVGGSASLNWEFYSQGDDLTSNLLDTQNIEKDQMLTIEESTV